MRNKKIHYSLSPEAMAIIDKRAYSPNKRGEWISNALVEYNRILESSEPDGTPDDPIGEVNKRLAKIERLLTDLSRKDSAQQQS